jgi:hypothetical protein
MSVCLVGTLASVFLSSCQPETPSTGKDSSGNCSLYGHRGLSILAEPFNQFQGSSSSKKVLRASTSEYEWYPLELSIYDSTFVNGNGFGSTGSYSQQCKEVLELLTDRDYLKSISDQEWALDLKLLYPNFPYESIFPFDENNESKLITQESTPTLTLEFQAMEPNGSGSYQIVAEKDVVVDNFVCDTWFSVESSWQEASYDADVASSAQTSNSDDQYFHFIHDAQFSGDECTFDFEESFVLKDGSEVTASITGGLEIDYEDGQRVGYTLLINAIDL